MQDIKIRYPLNFSMKFEDSEIPPLGKALLIVSKGREEAILSEEGKVIVLLDARMKKIIYSIQGTLEYLDLCGRFSIKEKTGGRKYVVLHVHNMKLLDALHRKVVPQTTI